jgi:hypothetical protein
MSHTPIEFQQIQTLKAFYDLMAQTRELRLALVKDLYAGGTVDAADIGSLKNALGSLEGIPGSGGRFQLKLDAHREIEVELDYEINELEKDILYLERGEATFVKHLEKIHTDFRKHVDAGVAMLEGKKFNAFITDRDGTINNYCGRYRSSVQSIYNAIWLTRFAEKCCENPIIITSAPLKDPGIVDVSVNPEKKIIYAASKGREFIDLTGTRRSFNVAPEKQQILDQLNEQLKALVAQPEYEKYSLIGSGLQLKFGQTTIARQDISKSIPAEESQAFTEKLTGIVAELDPEKKNFRIEDTGLDVEIILTIEGDDGLKDFDKADSVNYLASELGLEMSRGPHLVCGDTGSDAPMIDATMAHSNETYAIFVTNDEELHDRVMGACPSAVIVPSPDMLVAILNTLAR